jgi:hypothetical protein
MITKIGKVLAAMFLIPFGMITIAMILFVFGVGFISLWRLFVFSYFGVTP